MEVSSSAFTPKRPPLSPPFTSCIPPIVSIRRQFSGPRPPPHRWRTRGTEGLRLRLGLGFGVPFRVLSKTTTTKRRSFVFTTSAALDPQTAVVVGASLVAVSALTVWCFNYLNRKHGVMTSPTRFRFNIWGSSGHVEIKRL